MPRGNRKAVHFRDVRGKKLRDARIQHRLVKSNPRPKDVAPLVFNLYGLNVYAIPKGKGKHRYFAVSRESNYPAHEREHAEILAFYHRRGLNPSRQSMWAILEDTSMLTRIPKIRSHRLDWSFAEMRDFVQKGKMENFSAMIDFYGALSKHFKTDAEYRRALASALRSRNLAPHIKALGEIPIEAPLDMTYPSKNVRAMTPHLLAVLDFLERRAHALKKKVA